MAKITPIELGYRLSRRFAPRQQLDCGSGETELTRPTTVFIRKYPQQTSRLGHSPSRHVPLLPGQLCQTRREVRLAERLGQTR